MTKFLTLIFLSSLLITACVKEQRQPGSIDQQTANLSATNREACAEVPIPVQYDADGSLYPGGNVECSQLAGSYQYSTGRYADLCSGTSGDGMFSWTTDSECKVVSWTWNGPAGSYPCGMAVIIHGGNASNVYTYDSGCTSGAGLVAPLNGGGNIPQLSNITFCYNVCNTVVCNNETGFGGNTRGAGSAWWYAFDTQGPACQDIYAGQQLMDGGSICYDAATDQITVTLGDGWSLDLVSNPTDAVKAQGYNILPTKRPAAGLFTLYKGTSLTFQGNHSRYYVVHLDLTHCQ